MRIYLTFLHIMYFFVFVVEDITYFLVLQKFNEQACMWMHKHEPGTKLAFINTAYPFVSELVANQII